MQRIPAHVFQVWGFKQPADDGIPPGYIACRRTWMQLNPGVRVVIVTPASVEHLLDQSSVRGRRVPRAWRDKYFALPHWVQRSDMARLLWLYFHGGVYADMDTTCEVPLAQWPDVLPAARDADLILGKDTEEEWQALRADGTPASCTNWTMAAAPGHPFIGHLLHAMLPTPRHACGSQDDCILKTTGPHYMSAELAKMLDKQPHWFKHAVVNTDFLFGGYPGNPKQVPKVLLARHHFAGAWREQGAWWDGGETRGSQRSTEGEAPPQHHKKNRNDDCRTGSSDTASPLLITLVVLAVVAALVAAVAIPLTCRRRTTPRARMLSAA